MKHLLPLLIIFISMVNASSATEAEPGHLDLEQFILLACENDTKFQSILAEQLTLTYRETLASPADDFILSASGAYRLNLDDLEAGGFQGTISLAKLFPETGTGVTASLNTARKTVPTGTETYALNYGLEISQSLVRDAFGNTSRLVKEMAGLEREIANFQIIETYETYLAALITIYYQWHNSRESLAIASRALTDYERLLANIRLRRSRNVAEDVDVNEVYLQYLDIKETLAKAELNLKKNNVLIAHTTGLPLEAINEKRPVIRNKSVLLDPEKIYAQFINHARTAKILQLIEKKGSLNVRQQADTLLPSVKMFAGYAREESQNSLQENNLVYGGVRLEYSFPGNHQNARLGIARAEERMQNLTASDRLAALRRDIINLSQEITVGKELLELSKQREKTAAAVVAGQQRRYAQARLSLSELVRSMNAHYTRKLHVINHETNLGILINELLRLTDTLVSPEDIPSH